MSSPPPASFLDLLHDEAPRESFDALRARHVAAAADEAAAERVRREYDVALRLRESIARQRSREAELSALYETASDLSAMRDVDAVLAAIVRRARQLLHADMTYLSLNDEDEGASYMRVTDGALTAEFRRLRLPLGDGLLGLVAQTGAPWFTSDYAQDERFRRRRFIDDAVADEHIRAILGVPLVLDGRVIGTLLATHRSVRPFPPEEVSLLTSFAAHAVVALENARLFAELDEANHQLRHHSAAIEAAAAAHDRLTDLLLAGGGLADVVTALGEGLDPAARIAVLDASGTVLAGDDDLDLTSQDDAVARARSTGRAVGFEGGHLAPALAGQEHLATVVVRTTDHLDDAHQLTLERSAMVAGLVVLFERSVDEAEERLGGALLNDLLQAEAGSDGSRLRRRAVRQGAPLDADCVVAVLDVAAAPRLTTTRLLVRATRAAGGLAATHDGHVVALLPGDGLDPSSVGRRLLEGIEPDARGHVTVGIAPCAGDVFAGGANLAHAEARRVLRSLLRLGRRGEVADPAALGVIRMLVGTTGPQELDDFVTRAIGPVLEHDRRRSTDLIATLEAWFATGCIARSTAQRLHVHPNTVAQRLDRITELLGAQWRSPDAALDIQLALRVVRLRA